MKVTIETSDKEELEQLLTFLAGLKNSSIHIIESPKKPHPPSTPDPSLLFGMWKDHPGDIHSIRKKAWRDKTE
ncbi:MAG: hypothetical protein AAF824_13645 [Bacteroidota bacterium]